MRSSKAGLNCPVALVSILDEDRQVFIAHLGLPKKWAEAAETPLTPFLLSTRGSDKQPLIIGDATIHDLVRDNLAIKDLGVISYMGVPVTMPDGLVIGALAAIDGEPRPWTKQELELLSRIGKVASNQIATFLSERRWSSLFQQLEEGIIVGSVIRDIDGRIVDWRYDDVNPAWSKLMDHPGEDAPGHTMREVFPRFRAGVGIGRRARCRKRTEQAFHQTYPNPRTLVRRLCTATGNDKFIIIFIDVTDRMEAVEALRSSETKLRLIVEGAKDYVIVTIDNQQRITSWFGGAQDTFGWTEAEMLGRRFDEIFTQEDRAAGVPETEVRKAAADSVALDRRWHQAADGTRVFLDGTIRPFPGHAGSEVPGFIKVARNATSQKIAENRQLAFLELGDKIRELNDVKDVAFAAAEIMARNLEGATRAGYGVVDPIAETVQMLPDWCAEGIPTVAGSHQFRDYGSFIEDLKRGETVIIPDVAKDPRTSASAELFHSIGISVLVNVPIVEHGAFVGVMFVHYDRPHDFSLEERDFVRTIADRTREAISRIRAEQEQQVLNHEISHRLKIRWRWFRRSPLRRCALSPIGPPSKLLRAGFTLFQKHTRFLLGQDWSSARMIAVIDSVLGQLSMADRYSISGPDLELGPRSALSLALLMHELGTNALKYGAWSNDAGKVDVSWATEGASADIALVLAWNEHQGPPVAAPRARGLDRSLYVSG